MKKQLILMSVTLLLVMPIVFANPDIIRQGGNFSLDANDYIFFDIFNRSNSATIGTATTGQAWSVIDDDANADSEILDGLLVYTDTIPATSTGWHSLAFDEALSAGDYDNYTIELEVKGSPSGDTVNSKIEQYSSTGGSGTSQYRIGHTADASLGIYTTGSNAISPVFSWKDNTGWMLWKIYTSPATDIVNLTVFNLTVSNGVITYKEVGHIKLSSTRGDTVESIKIYMDRGLYQMNISSLVIYEGDTRPAAAELPDTTPPQITLINLTSEGGLGYIIYPDLGLMSGKARTNDTTPTFRLNTSENSECTIIDNRTDTSTLCTTTGAMNHICTEDVVLPIGLSNLTANCSDSSGNINATQFLINITDPIPPQVNIINDSTFFGESINNSIVFAFNSTDNYDSVFTLQSFVNGSQITSDTSYANGTEVTASFSRDAGTYNFSIRATDSFNNINETWLLFEVVDGTPPNITILSPVNNSVHTVDFVDLNWTSDESVDWCAYSLDDGVNVTTICTPNPLSITDLTDIDLTGLTYGQGDTCADFSGYIAFRFFNYSKTYDYGERKGKNKDECSYVDRSEGETHNLMMDILNGGTGSLNILEGDYITITYDGVKLNLSLPALSGTEIRNFYISNDGTFYNDTSLLIPAFGIETTSPLNITLTSLSEGSHNVTIWANDTLGNMGQSDYVYFYVDGTNPIVNVSINNTSPKINEVVNISANITDGIGLSFCQVIENQTGSIFYTNYSLSGTEDKCSKAITISVSRGNVINLTIRANDTSNHFTTNDTIITVANTIPPIPTIIYPTSDLKTKEQSLDLNVTFTTDPDGDTTTINYYINGKLNDSTTTNTTFNASDGTYILNVSLDDGADSSISNATVNFTIDTIIPVISNIYDVTGSGKNRTNIATPTINLTTNENADCNISTDNSTWTLFNTTGELNHNATVDSTQAFSIGENRTVYVRCNDLVDNIVYGNIVYNITDGTPPNITLHTPENNAVFQLDINNTDINFTFSATDNIDRNFTAQLYIDNVLKITNTTYLNGTNVSYFFDETTIGPHTWYVNSTDSFNNKNQSYIRSFTVEQEEEITIFLDGVNESGKYEYRTIVNISSNCTDKLAGTCQIELSLDADGFDVNFTSEDNWINISFNTTPLRIRNWSHGPRDDIKTLSGTFNVTSNNLTIIESVSFNVSSTGTTTNLNISYYGQNLRFRGDLKTIYLTDDEFIHSGTYKDAVNVTHISAGSSFIFADLTEIGNPINITFQLTGFNLDAENEFIYIEHFNGTDGSNGFNETLSYQADVPLGIFDDFVSNVSGRWNADDASSCNPTLSYDSDGHGSYIKLSDSGGSGGSCSVLYLDYDGEEADFRNSSRIEIDFARVGSCSRGLNVLCTSSDYNYYFYATDGTSQVELDGDYHGQCSGNPSSSSVDVITNYTLTKISSDYTIWRVEKNGTFIKNADLSSLDFTKQIKFSHRPDWSAGIGGGCSASASVRLYEVKVSGGWLNRSTTNGTYKPMGNITSNVLTVTETNISKATLTWVAYEPEGTKVLGYMSNTCNATIPTFEIVTSGLTHTHNSVGNEPCVRFWLNSSINISSPVVRGYTYDITASIVKNITVYLDEILVHTFVGGLNDTTTFVNLTPNPNQLNTIKISSETGGIIMIDQYKLNSSINPIILNKSKFEDCSNCIINFTLSGNNLEVSDLKWDFLGSWNFTAIARYGSLVINKTIQVYYSNFNVSLPGGEEWYNVFPGSKDSKNVTPYKQKETTPIWNISNLAYDEEIDIYVKTNESLDPCFNITYTNNSRRVVSVINESFIFINGTPFKLSNKDLINNSAVVFNQTDGGTEIGSNNYTVDYADGTITLNSSIFTNTTRINQSITITLDSLFGNENSSALEFISLGGESVRNASAPFILLTKNIDYRISEINKNFTLINETFNQTKIFVTYNYSVYTSYVDGEQFGINYSYLVYGFDYNTDFTFELNTSYQKIGNNISVNLIAYPSKGIWNWWNLEDCSNRFFIPWVYFSAICSECYFDESQLDNFNIIIT